MVEKAEGQVPGLDPKFDCIGGLLAHHPVNVGQTCLVLEQLFLAFELPLEIGDAHLLMMVVLYIYPLIPYCFFMMLDVQVLLFDIELLR